MGIPERKEREKQMRRDLILKAAEEVFFERGLKAATLDEIAERAEVSKGTIYLYFASKGDLYYSLMSKGLTMLLKAFEESKPDESNPRSTILRFGEAYLKFSSDQSYLFKMLGAVENPVVDEQISPEVLSDLENTSDKVLRYVARFVQQGVDAGTFRSDLSPYEAVLLFWVSLSGILNLKARAAATRNSEFVNKDSVLHRVDYDSLYDRCINFFTSFLVGDGPGSHANQMTVRKPKGRRRGLKGVRER
jgi:AcrR family transcriptional regulator